MLINQKTNKMEHQYRQFLTPISNESIDFKLSEAMLESPLRQQPSCEPNSLTYTVSIETIQDQEDRNINSGFRILTPFGNISEENSPISIRLDGNAEGPVRRFKKKPTLKISNIEYIENAELEICGRVKSLRRGEKVEKNGSSGKNSPTQKKYAKIRNELEGEDQSGTRVGQDSIYESISGEYLNDVSILKASNSLGKGHSKSTIHSSSKRKSDSLTAEKYSTLIKSDRDFSGNKKTTVRKRICSGISRNYSKENRSNKVSLLFQKNVDRLQNSSNLYENILVVVKLNLTDRNKALNSSRKCIMSEYQRYGQKGAAQVDSVKKESNLLSRSYQKGNWKKAKENLSKRIYCA